MTAGTDIPNDAQPQGESSGCVCPQAGFCERHQCLKTEHWHMLCQTRSDYFQLWEEGRGPGQKQPQQQEPGLVRKAANFGKAVVKHVANRRQVASNELFAARIAICEECDSLNQQRRVCTEKSCGCYIDKKARWQSENCPQGKWLASPDSTNESSKSVNTESTHNKAGQDQLEQTLAHSDNTHPSEGV